MNKTINFTIAVLLAVTFCMNSLADEPQTTIPPELAGAKWISGDCSQGLPVFRDVYIDNVVIEVHIPDSDIYQTILTDTSREQKADNSPTAIGGKGAAMNIGLLQELPQFGIGVCFDWVAVGFWNVNFKTGEILALHKEAHKNLQIPCVCTHGNFVQIRIIPQFDDEIGHGLFR